MIKTMINLQLFAGDLNTNTIIDNANLSPTRKVFYNTSLLENARTDLYFVQFGKKQQLPKNGGDKVEFRKFETFKNAITHLDEGVTPDGNTIKITKIDAKIEQYGDYTTISDRLELEAVDPIILNVTEEHGAQAGETMDILCRNKLLAENKNFFYAGAKTKTSELVEANKITAADVAKWRTFLKKMRTPTDEQGCYVAMIHPSVAEDLRMDEGWQKPHEYVDTNEIYNGEIGKLHGIRFIENLNAKIEEEETTKKIIYHTLVFGKEAYGVIEPTAESLEVIVKQKGSAGTSDPLDQRSTIGWKASTATVILYPERIMDFVSCSSYSSVDKPN